jgi:ribosomal protein S18 acetylase RimI-like enzyme
MTTPPPVKSSNTSLRWRPMTPSDLAAVSAIAARVHPDYPEDDAVFAERLGLYPAGCFVLATNVDAQGYLISHPWHLGRPPELNTLLGALPSPATSYYVHDLALLPHARGGGAAAAILAMLIHHARACDHRNISLVAVNNSVQFWQRQGFRTHDDAALTEKLTSYDAQARYMVREVDPPQR